MLDDIKKRTGLELPASNAYKYVGYVFKFLLVVVSVMMIGALSSSFLRTRQNKQIRQHKENLLNQLDFVENASSFSGVKIGSLPLQVKEGETNLYTFNIKAKGQLASGRERRDSYYSAGPLRLWLTYTSEQSFHVTGAVMCKEVGGEKPERFLNAGRVDVSMAPANASSASPVVIAGGGRIKTKQEFTCAGELTMSPPPSFVSLEVSMHQERHMIDVAEKKAREANR